MDTSGTAWKVYLAVGLALSVAQVLLDPASMLSNVVYLAIAASGPVAMLVALRSRPDRTAWMLLTLGVALMVAGDVLWVWYELMGRDPFPSLADALYLPGYPVIAAGLLAMRPGQRPGVARDSLVDATIIATGLGMLSWVFLVSPYLTDSELTVAERAVSAAYPLTGVLLVGVIARLAFSHGTPQLSELLVGVGLVALAIADTYLGAIELTAGYEFNPVAELLWLATYVLLGAAALAPVTPAPSTPAASGRSTAMPALRLPLLAVASLMAPAVLAWRAVRDADVQLLVVAGGSALLFLLVLVRVLGLLRRIEQQAARVRLLATTDPLTGLANRRQWAVELERLLAGADRSGDRLCVVMLDLDRFKPYNDAHGHHAGDRLLRAIAHGWREQVRTTDVIARLGGDEFALALPAGSAGRATALLARLRAAMPTDQTFSAGMAFWDGDESADELMIRADVALYAAKDRGRDRAVWADDLTDAQATGTDTIAR